MADSSTQTGASRSFGSFRQIATIYATDFRQLLTARKTLAMLVVQLIPVVAATVYVFFEDIDGLAMFSETVEGVTLPILVPLAALFYGGPALVDEMEGRTLTYLTLRPVAKPALFVGKWLAGSTIASLLVVVPVVMLLAIAGLAAGSVDTSYATIAKILAMTIVGTTTYTAIFAALGAAFARSLIGGIIYFVVVELIFGAIPTIELLSVRFHLRAAAEFSTSYRPDILQSLGVSGPVTYEWWWGFVIAGFFLGAAVFAGSVVFNYRQYHV